MTDPQAKKVEFLKGVGPQRATILQEELGIYTLFDLLQHFPFRYEDRSRIFNIRELYDLQAAVKIKGRLRSLEKVGMGRKKRLVGYFYDETDELELIWFKGIEWVFKRLKPSADYILFGKPTVFRGKLSMAHPEIEEVEQAEKKGATLHPVYHTTERMKRVNLDSRTLSQLIRSAIIETVVSIRDMLPGYLCEKYHLIPRAEAFQKIHYPRNNRELQQAQERIKFEELFLLQVRLIKQHLIRLEKIRGQVLADTSLLHTFYTHYIPFELTGAQQRVVREIFDDMKSGHQMNRLLQGDVGSGKTMVAFLTMLIAISSGTQTAMMAPTEILAEQHYRGLREYAQKLNIKLALLTGSTKPADRKIILNYLYSGELDIIVGTHALLEERVRFHKLGLAVIDEQHRFGVAHRAKLWSKNPGEYPHILVMTATPIPRTLAMTLYGDLDLSVIDELPAGRIPIETKHATDQNRLQVLDFIRKQVAKGHQVYVVYPLIEESQKLDLKDLMDGYESLCRAFPELHISIVHGRMKSTDKEFEMKRFVKGETHILVATTVIEVGVNVPNASVMVIENAERFGLAQLHQLRGRVGRGAARSYCVLMTKEEVSKEARIRISTMVRTTDGFEIADTDLKLRGPGDLSGTRQSGLLELKLADLTQDGLLLQQVRNEAIELIQADPHLSDDRHSSLRQYLEAQKENVFNWSRIS